MAGSRFDDTRNLVDEFVDRLALNIRGAGLRRKQSLGRHGKCGIRKQSVIGDADSATHSSAGACIRGAVSLISITDSGST